VRGTAEPSDAHHVHRHVRRRQVGVPVRDAQYWVAPEHRYPGLRYPEGQESGYRHQGRHRRYPEPKPATTDRCRQPEVAEIRIPPWRSSSTCPAGTVAPVQRGRPVARRTRSAAELPTRRQIRHCVVAKASLHVFSQLPSPWRSYDSGHVRGLVSTDRPFDGEYAYTRWPVDLSYGLIGCREPYHLDREPYDDFSPT